MLEGDGEPGTATPSSVSSEQVQYTYGIVNRLLTATESTYAWGQSYGYDGFGNLTGQTVTYGSAPMYSASPDPATNHLTSNDANGNTTAVNYFWHVLPSFI
jgi:YD repeat-containing protein